jgi:ATP-binding cassette subfamily C protein CydCD
VTPAASAPPTADLQRAGATLLGAAQTVAGLALAVLSAVALADVASGHVAIGLGTLLIALGARWLVALIGDEWSSFASGVIRIRWRARLLDHLRLPSREGGRSRGDLALAVENVSHAPALKLLEVSAETSALGIVVVFWAAGWLSTAIIISLLALAIPLYRRAGKRSSALELEYQQRRSLLEARQLELLHHTPELRALGAVGYGANEIAAISDTEHAIAMRAIRVALGSSLVTEFLSGVSIGLVAMVVGFGLLAGRISLEHALIAVLVTSELFGHVRRYGTEFHRRADVAASLELLNLGPPVITRMDSDQLMVAIDLVTEAALSPVNLRITPASRTLISGPSGSGKTTLLHTLLGWRNARSGSVQRSGALVGYVSVESSLFSGSLWDNLTLGADVDDSRVRQQLAALGLEGPRFTDLTTPLLADGRGLSGGETVRLVLARCLIATPSLLIIDDVSGVLDADSRDRVARELDAHPGLAVIEATAGTPLLRTVQRHVVVGQ